MILGTKTSLKLLAELFKDPLHEFKEIELIKKSKVGKGSAADIINELIEENIILERRAGKTKLVSLNMRNMYVFLLKNLFDNKKMLSLNENKVASVILFKNNVKRYIKLMLIFGSSIAGTANKKSDIDILVISDNKNLHNVNKERKKIEELFGERLNIHCFTEEEIKTKIKSDMFIKNALLKGVLLYGYDLGKELFSNIKEKKDLKKLFFFNERIKSALRNYLNKDHKTAIEIINRTLEQMTYYLLSEKEISYTSKKDAKNSIKNIPEGKEIQRIGKVSIKEKINLSEKFILNTLRSKILEENGYKRGN